ncbi:DUF4747 family protein [Acetobacter malorum]|nr:DUF4747 family protein [Acetobacter malorum]
MKSRSLSACALSLDATPHPDGVYVEALRKCANHEVRARGETLAKITAPRKIKNHDSYAGRLLIWTHINVQGKWLDKEKNEQLSDDEKLKINIPENAAPNYKTFHYVFTERDHKIYIETKNELGESLGPKTIKNIFTRLMDSNIQGDDYIISVTLVPDEHVVDELLSLPHLRKLELQIRTPNADYASPEIRRRVLDEMMANNAHVLSQTWTKPSNAEKLTPTKDVKDLTLVAADTGYVRATDKPRNGPEKVISTDDRPRFYSFTTDDGDTFFERLKAKVQRFMIDKRKQ